MKLSINLLLAGFLLCTSFSVAQAADDADALVDKIQTFYEGVNSYSAVFTQKAVKRMVNRTFSNHGMVWFKKPGKMRWEYQKPKNQLIVINGEEIWFYKPQTNEATLAKTKNVFNENTPVMFLSGVGNIADSFKFKLSKLGGIDEAKFAVLKLTPKTEGSQYTRILLVIERKTGRIAEVRLFDYMENENSISFDEVKINIAIDDSQFKFTPPPGTRLITPASGGQPTVTPTPAPEMFQGGR
jgi:outer membrane lipoprotein carrier protein